MFLAINICEKLGSFHIRLDLTMTHVPRLITVPLEPFYHLALTKQSNHKISETFHVLI